MKKLLFTILLLLIATPVSAKMLWEYGSFSERAELAVDNEIVVNISEYKGTYEQNINLLNTLESLYNLENPYTLGASTQPVALTTYNLAGSGVSSSATSITLQSLTIPQNDYKIQDADLSDIFYLTLEPGSKVRQEIVSCTTATQNAGGTATLSGCTRGLSPITPYTASTTLRFSHAGGSQVIFSDPPQLFNLYPAKANNEAITGLWTYNTLLPTSTLTATNTYQFINKSYADTLAAAYAATSTFWTLGANLTDLYYNAGNVGIGTGTPEQLLDVVAASGGFIRQRNYASGGGFIVDNGGDSVIIFRNSGVTKWQTGSNNANTNAYQITPSSGFGNKGLSITQSTGYVGLGTSTPAYQLDVYGNTRIDGNLSVSGTTTLSGISIISTYPTASTSVASKGYVDQSVSDAKSTVDIHDTTGVTDIVANGTSEKSIWYACFNTPPTAYSLIKARASLHTDNAGGTVTTFKMYVGNSSASTTVASCGGTGEYTAVFDLWDQIGGNTSTQEGTSLNTCKSVATLTSSTGSVDLSSKYCLSLTVTNADASAQNTDVYIVSSTLTRD